MLNSIIIYYYILLYTMIDKYEIYNSINELKQNDYKLIEIFKLIHHNNILYSKNINGIFIDINMLNDDILIEIYDILFNEIN